MKKLFIHNPIFRLLAPLFSGSIVYLLILLVNNNVAQLQDQFLGQELYVCIGLSYIIQEFSRLSLVLFDRFVLIKNISIRYILQIILSVALCVFLVSFSIKVYYVNVLGFSPNRQELLIFNTIFSGITLVYISLFLSHQFLGKINATRLKRQEQMKREVEEDFKQFRRGINPDLLFESLESLIVLMRQDQDRAEELLDHLSAVYRYSLTRKDREFVPLAEEIEILHELLLLFNHLPYRNFDLEIQANLDEQIVPGTLLFIVEQIIRHSIRTTEKNIRMILFEEEEFLILQYEGMERITRSLMLEDLETIQTSYAVYSNESLFLEKNGREKRIGLPKLRLKVELT